MSKMNTKQISFDWSNIDKKYIEDGATRIADFLNSVDRKYGNSIDDKKLAASSTEMVNHPAHYNSGKYEVIDVIQDSLTSDQFMGFLLGNVIKYVLRCQNKGKMVEDLRKAAWYLGRAISVMEALDE